MLCDQRISTPSYPSCFAFLQKPFTEPLKPQYGAMIFNENPAVNFSGLGRGEANTSSDVKNKAVVAVTLFSMKFRRLYPMVIDDLNSQHTYFHFDI